VQEPPASWRHRLKRWRWWIAAVVFILIVRVALPIVLRRVIASQASEALHARVEVGDVDLALWKGGVALNDVAVYQIADHGGGPVQAAAAAAGSDTPGPPPAPAGETPTHTAAEPASTTAEPTSTAAEPASTAAEPTSTTAELTSTAPEPTSTAQQAPGTAAQPDSTPATPGSAGTQLTESGQVPIVAFKRFAVELRYLPLFSKTIQVRDIAFDSPRVALDRLASGDLNIMALVPKSEVAVQAGATPGAADIATPTATAAPGETAASQWKIGLDRFMLRDGRVRFRDLSLPGSEPIELGIDQVAVQEIALSPGVYGEPAQLHVVLDFEGGAVDVAAGVSLLEHGYSVTCDLNAERLPLRHARLYVPKVGWSELKGELDLGVTYALETDKKNEIHGRLALRDVGVAVPQLEDVAAVAWKSLAVEIEKIDLIAQRAAVSSVQLDAAELYVRASGDQPLPVLAARAVAAAARAESPTPEPTPQETPPEAAQGEPAPTPTVKPWEWSVADVKVAESKVHLLSDKEAIDVGVDLTAANIASAADAIAHIALALGLGPSAIKLEGDARILAPAFGGKLQITDLALPPLVALRGAIDPSVLPSATLRADLAIEAGLPSRQGGNAPPDLLRVSGALGLSDAKVSPPGESALTVEAKDLDLTINELEVPGVIPGHKAGSDAALRLAADLKLTEPHVVRSGDAPLDFSAQSVALALSDVAVPAALAGLASHDAAQPIHATAHLDLNEPRVALSGADLSAQARTISLAVSEAALTAVPPGGDVSGAPPARIALQLDLGEPKVALAGGKQLAADAQAIALQLTELTLPGVTVGAPPTEVGAPLHAVATLSLTQPHALRGDGKEFSFAAKSIAVPATDVSIKGALAPEGPAPTVRAGFGDIRIDGPVARLTRTKDGIVLPGSAAAPPAQPASAPAQPASAPAAAAASHTAPPVPAAGANPPLEVNIASLRVTKGDVDFTDRAVQPVFHDRYAPIEVDARNVHFPNPSVKPLKLDIVSAAQGRITATGEFGPQGGDFEMIMDKLALTPFNPYAHTYSPYGISEGALSIKTTAKFKNGKYDVQNSITLHQLGLTGAEGDSLFEQQFGIPLTMVLALLRDTSGDIDLNIPVQVDQSGGATVDLISVVRSALRQALMGAIESPLKLVGGVIGMGGSRGSIAPAPIAFPLGHSEPTSAGNEAAQRLADFLTGRPAMAVQLDTAVTNDDVRWMHEQALHAGWKDESVLQRSLAFVTQRGPRERIGSYLTARANGEDAKLSDEDAATLQEWLDKQPAPTPEQLHDLAAARLAAVEAALQQKGIDPARFGHGDPGSEPVDGSPVVKITFRPVGSAAQAGSAAPTGDSDSTQH
jgi:hypothetical protein